MTFGGGLAPAMFGPIEGMGHQGDGGGVDDVEQAFFKAEGETGRVVAGEGGSEILEMRQHGPEELLGQKGIAGAIGVREGIFGRRRGGAQSRQRAGVEAQRITHVVETQGMSQLGVEQTDDLAPGAEGTGVIFDPGVPRQFGHQMGWNEVAKLAEDGEFTGVGLDGGFFHALPCGKANPFKPTFFYPSTLNPVGRQ